MRIGITSLYFFLLLLLLYLPNFSVIDNKAAQNLYLSIINSGFFLAILFKQKKYEYNLFKNPLILSFGSFLIIAILSTFVALNKIESLVRLTDISLVFITLCLVIYLLKNYPIKTETILFIVFGSVVLDVFNSIYVYIQIESVGDFGFLIADELRGFWGNKNILSVSLAIRTSILLILFHRIKSILLKFFVFLVATCSFYVMLLLSSRAVFLSILLTIMFAMILIVIKKQFFLQSTKKDLKGLVLYLLPIILSIIFFRGLVNQDDGISIENRASTIINSEEDRSISERLRFYSQSISYIKNRPLFGYGIGNWRIYSIEADSKQMASYIVPYFAHNDFLEVFVETGILGFLSYLAFFFFIFKMCLKRILLWTKNKANFESLLISFGVIFYFVDQNLNFPLDRTAMQIILIVLISVIINITNESKKA